MRSLIVTTETNDVDPQARLADVLARIPDHPASRLDQLAPWNWKATALVGPAAGSLRGSHRTLTS
jgi:hypothetical protein